MDRRQWRRALTVFSAVMAVDQIWKYMSVVPEAVPWDGRRLQSSVMAAIALTMLALVVTWMTHSDWLSPGLAGATMGAAVSLFVDRVAVGSARTVFDVAGVGDVATATLVVAAGMWIAGTLRMPDDARPPVVSVDSMS